MNLFTMNLDQAQYAHIEEFCQQGLPENVRLDYKRELSSGQPRDQVIKGISAFANTQGGILLYGVGTRGTSRHPDWPSEGMPTPPNFERQISSWCVEHISPPIVPFVKWIDNPSVSGKGFGVVRVEMSWHTPHTVEGGTRIYVRRRDNSEPLPATFYEIESMRSMRATALDRDKQHFEDLRIRVGPAENVPYPWMRLMLLPTLMREDALALHRLPSLANGLRSIGLRDEIARSIRSYSHGILSSDVPGWRLALTSRGAFGLGFVHPEAREQGIDLDSLVKWSWMGSLAAEILSKESGYWGTYLVEFDASNYQGVRVVDSVTSTESYLPCADDKIRIQMEWAVPELKADPLIPATRLFSRLLWSFGQHERMWPESTIRTRLMRSR